jgi:hypothetical protein
LPVLGEENGGQALAVICDAAVADVASGFVGKRGADEVVIGSKGRGKDGRWGTLLAFGLGQAPEFARRKSAQKRRISPVKPTDLPSHNRQPSIRFCRPSIKILLL